LARGRRRASRRRGDRAHTGAGALLAFLGSLTDTLFLHNPALSDPWKKAPRQTPATVMRSADSPFDLSRANTLGLCSIGGALRSGARDPVALEPRSMKRTRWMAIAALGVALSSSLRAQSASDTTTWGCTEASVDLLARPARSAGGTRTPIPPAALDEDITDLRLGVPFPHVKPHNLTLASAQVPAVERSFCAQDGELQCPGMAEREKLVAEVAKRAARIAQHSSLSAVARAAVLHVQDDLGQGRLPMVQFTTLMKDGPTAAAIRSRHRPLDPGHGVRARFRGRARRRGVPRWGAPPGDGALR
jgi:hypothetical protein